MAYDLKDKLVVGISSRALFDLEEANAIFDAEGAEAYEAHQKEKEGEVLAKGTGFPFVKALLGINGHFDPEHRKVEVVIMSRNSPQTGLRAFNSIEHYGLDIKRAAFTGGSSLAPYFNAYAVDLFLSRNSEDVQAAINCGIAGSVLYNPPQGFTGSEDEVRIAFDGDAVLFSDESEQIFQEQGIDAFYAHEEKHRDTNLPEGPFAKLLKMLSDIQKELKGKSPVRIAIVTARSSPAHVRVVKTLRSWDVHVDEAHFLGGASKAAVLQAFGAHIFFDDQHSHVGPASEVVPSAIVPSTTNGHGSQPGAAG